MDPHRVQVGFSSLSMVLNTASNKMPSWMQELKDPATLARKLTIIQEDVTTVRRVGGGTSGST